MGDTTKVVGQPELADALAGDITRGATRAIHSRSPSRVVHDDRAVRALRREPEDRLQVAGALRRGGPPRPAGSEPGAAPLSSPDREGSRGRNLHRPAPASELGPGQARGLAAAPIS